MKKIIIKISLGIAVLLAIIFIYSCTELIDESYTDIQADGYVYSEDDVLVIVNSA